MQFKNTKRLDNNSGFTLVEVLITVMILSFVLTSTVLAYTKSAIFMNDLREYTVVSQVLNEQMELIRDMPFDTVVSSASGFSSNGFNEINNATGLITIEDPFSDNNIKRVTLSVSWQTPQGRNITRSLTTLISRDGINRQ